MIVVDPRRSRSRRARPGGAGLDRRRAGRVRDRDRLRPGGNRHAAGSGRADLRGQGEAGVNPLIVHVAGIPEARACASDWPEDAQRLAERSGPARSRSSSVARRSSPTWSPPGRTRSHLRSPRGAVARGLIERVGQPVAAPSANASNRISPTRAEHVLADLDGQIDLVIDSGPTTVGLESTVLDLTGVTPRMLRPGPISRAELEAALGGRTVLDQHPGRTRGTTREPGPDAGPLRPADTGVSRRFARGARRVLDDPEATRPDRDRRALRRGRSAGSGSICAGVARERLEALYDVLHRAMRSPGLRSSWSCRRMCPSGGPCATALMRACRPLSER